MCADESAAKPRGPSARRPRPRAGSFHSGGACTPAGAWYRTTCPRPLRSPPPLKLRSRGCPMHHASKTQKGITSTPICVLEPGGGLIWEGRKAAWRTDDRGRRQALRAVGGGGRCPQPPTATQSAGLLTHCHAKRHLHPVFDGKHQRAGVLRRVAHDRHDDGREEGHGHFELRRRGRGRGVLLAGGREGCPLPRPAPMGQRGGVGGAAVARRAAEPGRNHCAERTRFGLPPAPTLRPPSAPPACWPR